jgi:type II secretory pathway pseudopilin PulG
MNIVSTMVGISIMGAAAPGVMQMSIAPFEAQKRAENFGIAESAAVVFAATYEGTLDIPANTDTCTAEAREDTENAYSVTCTHGTDRYLQSVTRAFRLAVPDSDLDNVDSASTSREFAYETPTRFSGLSCPYYDEWGTNGYNDQYYKALNGACIPIPVWTQTAYQFSNPEAWLYDVNNYNGWGNHPDY